MRRPILAALAAGATLTWGSASLAAQEEAEPPACRILGRVLDADLEAPIAGASVWLERGEGPSFLAGTSTGEDGAFELDVPRCLDGTLRVRMLGYLEAAEPVDFDAGPGDRSVTIRLGRSPLELEELQVEVPRSDRLAEVGFYTRKAWEASTGRDYGTFYDPEELHTRGEYLSLLGIVGWDRIRFLYEGCPPSWYLDGRRLRRPGLFLETIKPEELEGMEVYRAVWGAIPDGYRDPNSNICGVILLWTKGPPKIEVELCAPSGSSAEIRVEGRVLDAESGLPLPAAYVWLVTDATAEGAPGTRTIADADGRYRYCDLQAIPLTARAEYGGASGETVPVDGRFGPRIRLDLEVSATAADSASGSPGGDGSSR